MTEIPCLRTLKDIDLSLTIKRNTLTQLCWPLLTFVADLCWPLLLTFADLCQSEWQDLTGIHGSDNYAGIFFSYFDSNKNRRVGAECAKNELKKSTGDRGTLYLIVRRFCQPAVTFKRKLRLTAKCKAFRGAPVTALKKTFNFVFFLMFVSIGCCTCICCQQLIFVFVNYLIILFAVPFKALLCFFLVFLTLPSAISLII